jgi:glycosyltransferase involved in cell wall biosynthesis
MTGLQNTRIALLLPTVELGAYWQPVLHRLRKAYQHTILYTGCLWPNFDPTTPGAEAIQLVGETKPLATQQVPTGYDRAFIIASPAIVIHLLRFRPDVVFASSYSIWTLFALLLKPFCKWRVVIAYEGSSPNVDFRDSKFRTISRKLMSRFSDTFITNSSRGKDYLVEILGVEPTNIFARPYMVPHSEALLENVQISEPAASRSTQHPVFLYVGRLEARKGIHFLLESCAILQRQGYTNYKLQIIGTGVQRDELVEFVQNQGLTERVEWIGWVNYGNLGQYFKEADVFVFPTLEDTWGMVVLEAMVFGKPILCSRWAGASELVVAGENGNVFDPYHPDQLAEMMQRFIDHADSIPKMGEKSRELMVTHTPKDAAQFFADITSYVLKK